MIGYYIHHHGRGHYFRAASIAAASEMPVTALSSLEQLEDTPFADYIHLDRDDDCTIENPGAFGALHWAPTRSLGLRSRMARIAAWIADTTPDVIVVDVSVEVAAFVRAMGVPVAVMTMPGERSDPPHQLAHQLADTIIASWPAEIYVPSWLQPHLHKTEFVGGISRFAGRSQYLRRPPRDRPKVLVLAGAGGITMTSDDADECARHHQRYEWTTLGLPGGRWIADPWAEVCDCDVVVTHAGQGALADVAAARKPAVVVPEPRPYDEQLATAKVLADNDIAETSRRWPSMEQWPALLERALTLGGDRWEAWCTDGAAHRAAAAISRIGASP
jgi:UDP-N-acetylglucosamine--N-acetylmuramyl-(pentapeptide) pyrophosphoryl-undecaprenol N-acetylglucosamine transferase